MSQSQLDQGGLEETEEPFVAVSRSLAAPPEVVWGALVSPAGAEALLGHGASLGTKGQSWHSDDGAFGVVRSFHPLEQVRVSWHETPGSPRSVVEIDLAGDATGTRLDLRHDLVSGDLTTDEQRWHDALERFASVVAGSTAT